MISDARNGSSLPDTHTVATGTTKALWQKPQLVVAGVSETTLTIGGLLCDAVGTANGLVALGGLGGSLCV